MDLPNELNFEISYYEWRNQIRELNKEYDSFYQKWVEEINENYSDYEYYINNIEWCIKVEKSMVSM